MSKYYKNFILCGLVEFQCLICDEYFEILDDVDKHLRWEKHRKDVKALSYITKYKNDRIYKLGTNFYCEICNYFGSDLNGISAHIVDAKHKEKKLKPNSAAVPTNIPIKREAGNIILHDIIISSEEWNAFENKKCALCNVSTARGKHYLSHILSLEHIINLIQAKVVCEDRSRCYRKINPDSIYCFICKKIIEIELLENHWDDEQHIENVEDKVQTTSAQQMPYIKQRSKQQRLIDIYKEIFEVDVKKLTARCRTCDVNINFNADQMADHNITHLKPIEGLSVSDYAIVKSHRVKLAKTEICTYYIPRRIIKSRLKTDKDYINKVIIPNKGFHRSEMASLGETQFMRLLPGGRKAFCLLCKCYITGTLAHMFLHYMGKRHRGHYEQKGLIEAIYRPLPEYSYTSINQYIMTLQHVGGNKVFWINFELCVTASSFALVKPTTDEEFYYKRTKCFACNEYYNNDKHDAHFRTDKHKKKFLEIPVLTSLSGEFIRVIEKFLFHCGLCNLTFAYYTNLQYHLKQRQHIWNKEKCDYVKGNVSGEDMIILSQNTDVMYYQLMSLRMFDDVKPKEVPPEATDAINTGLIQQKPKTKPGGTFKRLKPSAQHRAPITRQPRSSRKIPGEPVRQAINIPWAEPSVQWPKEIPTPKEPSPPRAESIQEVASLPPPLPIRSFSADRVFHCKIPAPARAKVPAGPPIIWRKPKTPQPEPTTQQPESSQPTPEASKDHPEILLPTTEASKQMPEEKTKPKEKSPPRRQ